MSFCCCPLSLYQLLYGLIIYMMLLFDGQYACDLFLKALISSVGCRKPREVTEQAGV